ncbi:hypothetical protein J6590_024367 [Homalodisca vitripennis]|nr:hypothetical protein J6590_024361 [Homalodisca vitripennis]KAG8337377.1 hypothetical protein J6590_024367 [Homalodisca vitripennis]
MLTTWLGNKERGHRPPSINSTLPRSDNNTLALCHVNHVLSITVQLWLTVLWWRHMYSCQTLQFGFVPCPTHVLVLQCNCGSQYCGGAICINARPCSLALCHVNHVLSITVQLWLTVLWWRHMYSCQTLQFGFVPCQPCSEYYSATVAHSTVVAPYVFMPDPAAWLCAMSTMF